MTVGEQAKTGPSLDELRSKLEDGELDTVILGFCDMQGRLMGKRLTRRFFLEQAAEEGAHFCVYLLGTDMEMNTPPGFPSMSWEQGYGDWTAKPDWNTIRILPWLPKTALVLADVVNHHGELVEVAPRTILRRQLERAMKMGFTINMASELEFYLIRETYEAAFEKSYKNLKLGGHYNEDYNLLQGTRNEPLYREFRESLTQAGIPIEGTKGEAGIGQHEINAVYADALEMADRHLLIKQGLKEIAMQHGAAVTFMAKPDHAWTGSSSHFHISLWEGDNNVFHGPSDAEYGMSDLMRHFLAGILHNIRDLSILFAPNINSYKRYAKGSWAPTNVVWGVDNRTCGLRVVGGGKGTRIENRFPGADTNPYLSAAAMIAAGLDGIEQRLQLPPEWKGNAYMAGESSRLPESLAEAIEAFEGSSFARATLGDLVFQHYLNAAKVEQEAYNQVVTDWEKHRYFEQV